MKVLSTSTSPRTHRACGLGRLNALSFRHGMTLVEMLVAMTLTLIMMGLVAQLFGMLGQGVNGSRSQVELYNQMRATAQRLRQDLSGVTAAMNPPLSPEQSLGYFEYIEGPETDAVGWGANRLGDYALTTPFAKATEPTPAVLDSDDRLVGDVDDVLLFTTRSTAAPFAGRLDAAAIESSIAEVVWYCRVIPNTFSPRRYNLYRRQKIVMGNPAGDGAGTFSGAIPNAENVAGNWATIEAKTDISCRMEGNFAVPNNLGDLTNRENRFCHSAASPHTYDPVAAASRPGATVLLTNCIGFDVKAFSNSGAASVKAVGSTLVSPSDPGYGAVLASRDISVGLLPVYNDLGIGGGSASGFMRDMRASFDPPSSHPLRWPTYDTWSTTLTSLPPPYAGSLRGVEVRIRCYEPRSRKVLQISVRQSF